MLSVINKLRLLTLLFNFYKNMKKSSHYKILITGITSIHGWPIFNHFQNHYPGQILGIKNNFAPKPSVGKNVLSINSEDTQSIKKICQDFSPTHIIQCSGLCDLDAAEDCPERAYELNVKGASNIVENTKECRLIYISYDLIFSGKQNHHNGYTEEDIPDPLTVVGKTIVEAEKVFASAKDHLIIRLGLPMGPSVQGNKGAVDWIESRFKKSQRVTLLYDEVRSTINTNEIGKAVDILMESDCQGIINLGCPNKISLYNIGEKILNSKKYHADLLEGKFRVQFPPSPPRMGDVSLDSKKAYNILGWIPQPWNF